MTTPVVEAGPDEPFAAAVRRMHEHRVGSVVVTEHGRVLGIVTERDALRQQAEGTGRALTAGDVTTGDVMTSPADCLDADASAATALVRMRERGYRHMPVVEGGAGGDRLVGIVSLRDLARVASIGPADVPRGLAGVVVTDTTVGHVRGDEGFYHYRQYSAVDLARRVGLEDVWRLMVDGSLPADAAEARSFRLEVRALRALPPPVLATLPDLAGHGSILDGVRSALSVAGASWAMAPLLDAPPAQRRADALRLVAVLPTIVAALHRLTEGRQPIEPRDDLAPAANLLWMIHGDEPDPDAAAALEAYLITTVDHGFNASTFTARVVASTGADMAACLVAAVGALSGPLHGGAPSRALDLLDEIGDPTNAEAVVRAHLATGERIMGFGHRVYRTEDPRSVLLADVAERLGRRRAEDAARVARAREVEQRVVAVLDEHRPGRSLRANVEYYAGIVMDLCGLPQALFTPAFACSRAIGWTAHVLEQAQDPKIIRPDARYVGDRPPRPVPDLLARTA